MSPIEDALKSAFDHEIAERDDLDGLYLWLWPQLRIFGYVCDFVVMSCGNKIAVVECDGHEFHERTKQQASYDRARDRTILKEAGLPTIRFTGSDIHRDREQCAKELIELALAEADRSGLLEHYRQVGIEPPVEETKADWAKRDWRHNRGR